MSGFYEAYRYADHLTPGKKLKIEHSISLIREKADISELVPLPLRELERRREDSANAEQAIFERLCASVSEWEEQAAITQLLDSAIEYDKTPAVSHSSNKWDVDEHGNHSRSNAVYQMSWRVYEDTRYDRELQASVPVAWRLTWDVRLNLPVRGQYGNSKSKIAGQEGKRFTEKAAMEKYLTGRIAAYSHLFVELFPPVQQEYADFFKVNGLMLPGYSVADNTDVPVRSEEASAMNGSEKASAGEYESVLEKIASDRAERKAKAGAARDNPTPEKKKSSRSKDEEL